MRTIFRRAAFFPIPFLFACAGTPNGDGAAGGTADGGALDADVDGRALDAGVDGETPGQIVTVVPPTTGLHVQVALAAAHLGAAGCTHDESTDLKTMACAILPDAGLPRGTGPCGGPCDFSNLQIAFTAGSAGGVSHIQITSATIVDAITGADLEVLTAYTPLAWNGTLYTAWDQTLTPSTDVKASYTLSPPQWESFDPSGQYSRQYKLRVVVVIDGSAVTVQSEALNRDPPVAT